MSRIQNVANFEAVPSDSWPIEGVVSGLTVLWGAPGLGKSFVAVSMAASIASGRPWIGRRTHEGRVVYVAGEGGGEAVARRLRAALKRWSVDVTESDLFPADTVDLDVVTPGINLVAGPDELKGLIGDRPPRLIIVDTLSRCFSGDENKQEFMGAFVRTLDALRDHYGCAILVIHHANRQAEMRGSSVLSGAVDVSWRLTKARGPEGQSGPRLQMTADKLRERDVEGASICLQVEKVICTNADGKPESDEFGDAQTSLVIKPPAELMRAAERIRDAALPVLKVSGTITYTEWRALFPHLTKPEFDGALSLVITYPGRWGIEQDIEEANCYWSKG